MSNVKMNKFTIKKLFDQRFELVASGSASYIKDPELQRSLMLTLTNQYAITKKHAASLIDDFMTMLVNAENEECVILAIQKVNEIEKKRAIFPVPPWLCILECLLFKTYEMSIILPGVDLR